MGKTSIEWTDYSWPVITGCSRVSEGCRGCYAERLSATRLKNVPTYKGLAIMQHGQPHWTGEVRLNGNVLNDPLHWKKPRRVFVCEMSDLFHEKVKDEWIDRIFAVMALCPQHTFQVLTKRPERMRKYLSSPDVPSNIYDAFIDMSEEMEIVERTANRIGDKVNLGEDPITGKDCIIGVPTIVWPLPNVWLGTSVEDQPTADKRVPELLQTPAAVRFVSYEPALAAVKFNLECGRGIDWVIAGGESGPGARPAHPDWFRSVRDQCIAAGVPFFMKQWGEWGPFHSGPLKQLGGNATGTGKPLRDVGNYTMARFGKKAAGRLLDGREWNEYPKERS